MQRPGLMASVLLVSAVNGSAQAIAGDPPLPPPAPAPAWDISTTAYYYSPKDQSDYLSAIAMADRGALHLETRYNYEALDSGSLFAGWTFSGGETLTYAFTPILGVVFGGKQGVAPGFEASAAYGSVDFYIEAEYVHDFEVQADSYTYAWSELGFSPLSWLRVGIVGQRSRAYESERDIQRGGFAQFSVGKLTLGSYIFNPDDSADRLVIFSLGASF